MQTKENIPGTAGIIQLPSVEFDAHYKLVVNNEFTMGKANPVMSLHTTSSIFLQQAPYLDYLYTSVKLNDITGKTDSPTLAPHLQQLLTLSTISPKIIFERNTRGKMLRVYNKETLQRDWQQWKSNTLPQLFDDTEQQQKFADNYEKGLQNIEATLMNNLNYYIMMPDLYGITLSNPLPAATDTMTMPSKLVADMPLNYRFAIVDLHDTETLTIHLATELVNEYDLRSRILPIYYDKQEDYTAGDYSFSINIGYQFEKQTGKILSANLMLKEKMHDHLQYILSIELAAIRTNNS